MQAQSADGRYISRMTQDGTLYFINPQKLSKTEGIKNFEYDMTLLSWTDSATVNFTFRSGLMAKPENLAIRSGNNVFRCDAFKPLFIDIKKNKYEIRITSRFPISVLATILDNPDPSIFDFTQDGIHRHAAYSEGAWRKDRKKLNDIYRIYLYSK